MSLADEVRNVDIIIKNGYILTMDDNLTEIKNGVIAIQGNKIVHVGSESSLEHLRGNYIIDAKGKFVLPGFINGHTHIGMSLMRGLGDDLALMDWLTKVIWPFELKMSPEDVYIASLLSIAELLQSGVTTINDMYFHMDSVVKAIDETGIRAIVGYGMIDLNNEQKRLAELKEERRFIENTIGRYSRIMVSVTPHAANTCSSDLLKESIALAKEFDIPIHIHLSETKGEVEAIRKETGKSPVEYLKEIGLFEANVIAAHGVWLSDKEIEILSSHSVSIIHNPSSNLKLGSGISPVHKLLQNGVNVGLGTDGPASNNNQSILLEARLAALLQKGHNLNPKLMSAVEVLKMATSLGAKSLGIYDKVGSLEVGKHADIILIDSQPPHSVPSENPYSTIVYSAWPSDISDVFVDGRHLIKDHHFETIDITKIIDDARKAKERILNL